MNIWPDHSFATALLAYLLLCYDAKSYFFRAVQSTLNVSLTLKSEVVAALAFVYAADVGLVLECFPGFDN